MWKTDMLSANLCLLSLGYHRTKATGKDVIWEKKGFVLIIKKGCGKLWQRG